MNVSWGQEASGLWSSDSEAWLSWCYPFSRAVTAVFVGTDGLDMDPASIQLAAFSPDHDAFALVSWQAAADCCLSGRLGFLLSTTVRHHSFKCLHLCRHAFACF